MNESNQNQETLGSSGTVPATPPLGQPWWHNKSYRTERSTRSWLASTAILTVAICTAFVLVFKLQISPAFSYGGIVFREPNYFFLGLSYALVWTLLLILGRGPLQGPRMLTALLVYVLGIPALIIPNIIEIESRVVSFGLVAFFFVSMATIVLASRMIPHFEMPRLNAPEWSLVAILIVHTVSTFWLLASYVGLSWLPVSLSELYDARAEYSEKIRLAPQWLGYMVAIQGRAIGPILLLIGMVSRRWRILALVGATGQYILFTTTFAKQSLFSIFAIIAAYVLFRLVRNADQRAIALVVLVVTILASSVDWLRGRVYWSEILIDRFFFWPGFLPVQYHETYRSTPFNFWSDSVLKGLIPDQSPGEVPELLVGKDLTGSDGVFANSSFLGDGYANMGFPGILVEAAVLVVLIYVVGVVSRRYPLSVVGPLMVMPAVALTNGSPFTAILSGGLLPLIFIMWLSPTSLLAGDDVRGKSDTVKNTAAGRKRVTIVTGYFDEFSEYYEVSLARELSKLFDVTVVTGNRVAPVFDADTLRLLNQRRIYDVGESSNDKHRIVRLPYMKIGSLLVPRGLIRALRAQNSHFVLILGVGQGFSMPAVLFSRLGIRVSVFGDNRAQWASVPAVLKPLKWAAFSLTKGIMYWFVMQRSDLVYGVTPNTLTRLQPFSGGSRMKLLPLPVDPSVFNYSNLSRIRARSRYELSGFVFGVVGKVSREKQIERALDGFIATVEQNSNCYLVISGLSSDSYSEELRRRVESDSLLSSKVLLLGFLPTDELADLMSGIDVCLWPVQPAITIQQALVVGCRVVVPEDDLSGFLTNDGMFGTSFEPHNWFGFSEAMMKEASRSLDAREREDRIARTKAVTTPALIKELIDDVDHLQSS